MADKPTTNDVSAGSQYDASDLNANFETLETAIEGCLGRGGTNESPNSMEGDLDMDLHNIINVGNVSTDTLQIDGELVAPTELATTTLPLQTGNEDKLLSTNGSSAKWVDGVIAFDTVALMKAASIGEGTFVDTKGYYAAGGGGAARYLIKTAAQATTDGDVIDEYGSHTLANSNVAVLQVDSAVYPEIFGAVKDGTTDDLPSLQAGQDYAEAKGFSYHITGGTYGIDGTFEVMKTAAIRVYGDGIRDTVIKKLSDNTGVMIPKTGIDDGIIEYLKIEGRGNDDPTTNTVENTAGFITYRKMQRALIFIEKCSGPSFTDPYFEVSPVQDEGYAAGFIADGTNVNSTKDCFIFASRCYGDAVYVSGTTNDANDMDITVKSFQCTGFAINAQQGFRNRFRVFYAQGTFHYGVCLCDGTDTKFDIQYVEKGDFSIGAVATGARNVFEFQDIATIATPYDFSSSPNNIWIDRTTRDKYIGGSPVETVDGTAPAFLSGVRVGGEASENILSLYEEGSWTVELYDAVSGGNVSPTTTTGYYTQIGNTVMVNIVGLNNIDTTGMTGANSLYFSLPKAANSSVNIGSCAFGSVVTDSVTFPAGRGNLTPISSNGDAMGYFIASGDGTTDTLLTVGGLASGSSDIVRLSLTYFI